MMVLPPSSLARRIIYLLCITVPCAAGPPHSWETLPVFFHGSNQSGPYSNEAISFIASRFAMVTIEKFQGPCSHHSSVSPACREEDLITAELRRIKLSNSNVSTVFYFNSVLDFPQYTLHAWLLDDPTLALHDEYGKLVQMHGGGHTTDVFDFGKPGMRELFREACANVTATGVVDGFFMDRSVHGTPCDSAGSSGKNATDGDIPCDGSRFNLDISDADLEAYHAGHLQVLADIQADIGDGPLVANRGYGPPHDLLTGVSFSMIENFRADNVSISKLLTAAANGRGVQAHAGSSITYDKVAAFLIGAGESAYLGIGGWSGTSAKSVCYGHWDPIFAKPLGSPSSAAVLSTSGVWSRSFNRGKIRVAFNTSTNKGSIQGWNNTGFTYIEAATNVYDCREGIECTRVADTETPERCGDLCDRTSTCLSFTWHDQHQGNWAHACLLRIDGSLDLKAEAGHVTGVYYS